jgi:alpha-tubulin suppressor-like RCC1 family protein
LRAGFAPLPAEHSAMRGNRGPDWTRNRIKSIQARVERENGVPTGVTTLLQRFPAAEAVARKPEPDVEEKDQSRVLALQFSFLDEGEHKPAAAKARAKAESLWPFTTRAYTWGAGAGAGAPPGAKGKILPSLVHCLGGNMGNLVPGATPPVCGVANAAGPKNSLVVTANGGVMAVGENVVVEASMASGGQNRLTTTAIPTAVPLPIAVSMVASGERHCVAVAAGSGLVFTWGDATMGRLGRKITGSGGGLIMGRPTGAASADLSGAERAGLHVLARDSSRVASRWGLEAQSLPASLRYQKPGLVDMLSTRGLCIVRIACGTDHTVALDSKGRGWGWGRNDCGQCGVGIGGQHGDVELPLPIVFAVDGDTAPESNGGDNPRGWKAPWRKDEAEGDRITESMAFCLVSCGGEHTVLLSCTGDVWTCGQMGDGRCGLTTSEGNLDKYHLARSRCASHLATTDLVWHYKPDLSMTPHWTPKVSLAFRSWFEKAFGFPRQCIDIAAGGKHTLVVDVDGRVWAFGSRKFGQTGVPAPVVDADDAVRAATEVASMSTSQRAARIAAEKLDDNDKDLEPEHHECVPVEVQSLSMRNAVCGRVGAGLANSAAVDHLGRVWTWGGNLERALGRSMDSWARHRAGLVRLPDDVACLEVSLGWRHGCVVGFRRPFDYAIDRVGVTEPLWESVEGRGVPVSLTSFEVVPRNLRSKLSERCRHRLRSIYFCHRVHRGAKRFQKKRSLFLSEVASRNRKHRARAIVSPPTALQPSEAYQLFTADGTISEEAFHRALALDPTRQPAKSASRPRKRKEDTTRFRFAIPSHIRDYMDAPRPIPDHHIIASTDYLLDRLATARKFCPWDDSVIGQHQAATVLQYILRYFIGRRRAWRRYDARCTKEREDRKRYQVCATEAAFLATSLSGARTKLVTSLEMARSHRTLERDQAASDLAELNSLLEDMSVAVHERRKHYIDRKWRFQKGLQQDRADSILDAEAAFERDRELAAQESESSRLQLDMERAEHEARLLHAEDELSSQARRMFWDHYDEHRRWQRSRDGSDKRKEAEEFEGYVMKWEDNASHRMRNALEREQRLAGRRVRFGK